LGQPKAVLSAHTALSSAGKGTQAIARCLDLGLSAVPVTIPDYLQTTLAFRTMALVPGQVYGISDRESMQPMRKKILMSIALLLQELRDKLTLRPQLDAILIARNSWKDLDILEKSRSERTLFFTGFELEKAIMSELADLGVKLKSPSEFYIIDDTCTSATVALAIARELILEGAQSVLVLGLDPVSFPGNIALSRLGVLAQVDSNPSIVGRPFSKSRSGFVRSDGLVAALIESENYAKERGEDPVLELMASAQTSDGSALTAGREDANGVTACMENCIRAAKISAHDISVVKSHGTGTALNDRSEASGVHQVFKHAVPIVSFKGQFGHTLNCSGLFELIHCEHMMRLGVLFPMFNCEDPDETLGLNLVRQKVRLPNLRFLLSNSFGFGGYNACLMLRRIGT
jgi:hypothetical protein